MATEAVAKRFTGHATTGTFNVDGSVMSASPSAAIGFLSWKTTNAYGDELNGCWGYTETNTTDDSSSHFWSEHALGTTDTVWDREDEFLELTDGSNYYNAGVRISHSAVSAGRWTLNQSYRRNSSFASLLGMMMMFGGTGVQSHIFRTSPTTTNLRTITPGFEADVVLFQYDDDVNSYGFGVNDGSDTNRGLYYQGYDGDTTSNSAMEMSTVGAAGNTTAAWNFEDHYTENFTSTTFDIRSSTSSYARVSGIALKFDESVWLGSIDMPTSTGFDEVTGPGWAPQAVVEVWADVTAYNSITDHIAGSVTFWSENDDLGCYAFTSEDGQGTTDTGERLSTTLCLYDGPGSLLGEASDFQTTSSGWKRDWTTVPGSTRKGFALAIGGGTAPASGPPAGGLALTGVGR